MGRLVLRRLGATIPVLLLVTAGVFSLLHLTPGDPIDAMMAESVDATVKETLRRELGLDQPIPVQYAAWMSGCCTATSAAPSATASRSSRASAGASARASS